MTVNLSSLPSQRGLPERLQNLRDEFNLNILMMDLKIKEMSLLVKILQSLALLKEFWEEKDLHLYIHAASSLHELVSDLVVGGEEYHTNIVCVLELHEAFEIAMESFLYGTVQEVFQKNSFIQKII